MDVTAHDNAAVAYLKPEPLIPVQGKHPGLKLFGIRCLFLLFSHHAGYDPIDKIALDAVLKLLQLVPYVLLAYQTQVAAAAPEFLLAFLDALVELLLSALCHAACVFRHVYPQNDVPPGRHDDFPAGIDGDAVLFVHGYRHGVAVLVVRAFPCRGQGDARGAEPYHLVPACEYLFLRLLHVRMAGVFMVAPEADYFSIVLVINIYRVPYVGHAVEVIADARLVRYPRGISRSRVRVKLHLYLVSLHGSHPALEDAGGKSGLRGSLHCRTDAVRISVSHRVYNDAAPDRDFPFPDDMPSRPVAGRQGEHPCLAGHHVHVIAFAGSGICDHGGEFRAVPAIARGFTQDTAVLLAEPGLPHEYPDAVCQDIREKHLSLRCRNAFQELPVRLIVLAQYLFYGHVTVEGDVRPIRLADLFRDSPERL